MANSYVYVPRLWLDQIIELDQNDNVIYEKDDQGNVVYWKDAHGNYVLDPVTMKPIPKPKLLQEGTMHMATYENHQEQGIAKSHERLDGHDKDILRIKVQMELDGRAPGNSGAFIDTFEGEPNKLVRQSAVADITTAVTAGATVLSVDNMTDFAEFTQVTVYDGTNSEDVLITAIGADTITVQALVNDYVKGARIARSNAKIDGQLSNGDWGTYTVSAEVV